MDVRLSLYLWNKANWMIVDDLFYICLYTVCKHYIEDFCILVHQGSWPVGLLSLLLLFLFIFCYCFLSILGLGVRVLLAS